MLPSYLSVKMKYNLLLFFLFTITVNGQKIISPNFSIKPSPFEIIEYGKSFYNIYYKVDFLDNALLPSSKKEVVCILEVNDKVSKFFDNNKIRIDSLDEVHSIKNTVGQKGAGEYFKTKVLWNNVIFKNGNSLTVQDRFRYPYQYDGEQPALNWNLEKGEKDILGYKCKKAKVNYAGRTYFAWYTPDIPLYNGPYIFGGLPGLILEVEDSDKKYTFTAVGIDKNPKRIYLRNEKKILKITREKFKSVQKAYRENPGAFYNGKAYNEDGSPLTIKPKNIQYESMELD